MTSARATALLLLAITAAGALVRCLGLRLGLPFFHHWDECWVVWSAENMLKTGSDVPTSYQYGAPMSELIALVAQVAAAFGATLRGDVALRWVGRGVSVAIATSSIPAVYLAGRDALGVGRRSAAIGLYAAALYAFAYELVTHARYAVTDASLVAFCAWSLAFAARYVTTRRPLALLGALLSAGVGFAFKPTAAPLIAIPALTALVFAGPRPASAWSRLLQRALTLGLIPGYFACFLLLNRHYVDHWPEALRDLQNRIAQTRDGGFPSFLLREPGLPHVLSALDALAGHTVSRYPALSWGSTVFAVIGIGVSFARRLPVPCIALAHAFATVLVIAWPNRTFLLRNYLVCVPAYCIAFALGLDAVGAWLRARSSALGRVWLLVPALGFLPAIATVRDSLRNQALAEDARLRAVSFIERRAGTKPVSVVLTPSVVAHAALGGSSAAERAIRRPQLRYAGNAENCDQVTALAPDYVIIASYRGDASTYSPYREIWFFEGCPGYRAVADFAPNPYEHTYWVTETWDGRASARVLERVRQQR